MIGLFSKETRARIAVTPAELRVVLWAGAYFFFVLASFSILKPIRDQFGIRVGIAKLPLLFFGTWLVMLLLNPLYGAVVSRLTRRRFIPLCYRFFGVQTLLLFGLMVGLGREAGAWIGPVFYIWLSAFNLWVVSVFWSFMADNFGSASARRLYPWIAVGATLGSIAGALVVRFGLPFCASLLGQETSVVVPYLLLVSFLAIEGAVWCARRVMGLFDRDPGLGGGSLDARPPRLGGRAWDGLAEVVRSPYLLRICLYLLCYTVTGTMLYLMTLEIVAAHFATPGEQTQALALINLVTQSITLLVQVVLTRRLIASLGIGRTLGILPLVAGLAFVAIWAAPLFWVVTIVEGLRRSTRYAVSKPTREVLFSVLDRSEKYKAKAVIDTFVYRGGDVVGGGTKSLIRALGPGLFPVALVGVSIAGAWAWLSLALGRAHAARARARGDDPS